MRKFIAVAALLLSGCGNSGFREVTPDPANSITIEKAFEDSAKGISTFKNILQGNNITLGMVVCKIEVNFNISAQAAEGHKAALGVGIPIQAAKIDGNISVENSASGTRGNNVSFVLQSVYPELCSTDRQNPPAQAAQQPAPSENNRSAAPSSLPQGSSPRTPSANTGRTPTPAQTGVEDRVAAARRDAERTSRLLQLKEGLTLEQRENLDKILEQLRVSPPPSRR